MDDEFKTVSKSLRTKNFRASPKKGALPEILEGQGRTQA
jgi:hypothetical protein